MKNNNNDDKLTVEPVVDDPLASPHTHRPDSQPESRPESRPEIKSKGWAESSSDWIAPPARRPHGHTPRTAALIAKDLSVSYGKNHVLRDVSFTLYQGDTLGLLGLNGAGKSTLLKVLSGAMAPDKGTVRIGDHELYDNIIEPRMSIGYAPDKPAVYPEFRVTEFLNFVARMRRLDRRTIKNSVDLIIDRCALGEVRNRIIGNLSTGYQQRVNIAQAMVHAPKILILDEPSNGLDPVQLMEIRELVSTLAPEQATLFSSHLLSEVNSICNRVMLIDTGKQILDAPLMMLSDKRNKSFEIRLMDNSDFNLNDLPGVNHACKTNAGHWLITGDSLTPDHLKTMLESRGQQAIQITPTDNYLESLFKQLAAKSDNPVSNTDSTNGTGNTTGNITGSST